MKLVKRLKINALKKNEKLIIEKHLLLKISLILL